MNSKGLPMTNSVLPRAMRIAAAVTGLVLLTACTSTQTATSSHAVSQKQSFAFAAPTLRTLPGQSSSNKTASKQKSSQKAELQKRKLADAKRKLQAAEKQLSSYDAMTKNLSEAQKELMKSQRDYLAKKVETAQGAVGKLEASLMPKAPKGSGSGRYHALIAKYARANGVPIKLAHAVVRVESAYRANARGGAGEIGLMQLKLSTARMMGYGGSAKGLYNPETNIRYGMKYLGEAHRLAGGSTCGTILRYNAGHGAKRMNPVSARYCKKVRRYI